MNKTQIKNFLNHISALGSKENFILYIIFLYLLNLKPLSYSLAITMILMYSIGILVRILYFKERPEKKQYNNILEKIDASSFPSMHASRATILLITLSTYFNFELKITTFLTLIWGTILYARIHKKRHDYKDIIGGTLLGIITFSLVYFI